MQKNRHKHRGAGASARETPAPVFLLEEMEHLLEVIAYENFKESRLLFDREHLENRIADYLRGRAGTVPAGRVLEISESHLGLLVQRAKGVYSFSHLAFQEFFTSRRMARNETLIDEAAVHLPDSAWREVWLLLANQKDPAFLLPRLAAHVEVLVREDSKLQELLAWVARKSAAGRTNCKPVARRAIYVFIATRAHALDHAHTFARADALTLAFALAIHASKTESPALLPALEGLKRSLPESEDIIGLRKWVGDLRAVMIEHRDIGHDWDLSEDQHTLLDRYLAANKLLADCMNESRTITQATRDYIESRTPSGR